MVTITLKSTEINIIPNTYYYDFFASYDKPTFLLGETRCITDSNVCKTCPAKDLSNCVTYFTSEFYTLQTTHPEIFI